jgi:hypothetical protein
MQYNTVRTVNSDAQPYPSHTQYMYREFFNLVDWFHSSALHGDWGVACTKAHKNFADESACLMAVNVCNEEK